MKLRFSLGAAILAAASSFCPYSSAAPLDPKESALLSRANRHQKAGWTYLHIEGEPRERGFQYGYLMAKEIQEALRVRRALWTHDSGHDWEWLVAKSKAMFTPKVDAELTAELDGMVEGLAAAGVKTDRDELVAFNGYFDLAWYWWPKEKKKEDNPSPNPPKQACSSFIATGRMTRDGGVVLGHNTWFGFPEADFDVILDIQPTKGHRILMQTAPGWIHSGTDFFVTDAGLVGSETTIGDFHGFDEAGIPEFVRMRRATQDSSSIDEWCAAMRKGNNGGYANAWLLGDVKTNEIARLELGLKHVGFERTKDGFFVGSNVAEDLKVLRFETDTKDSDIRQSSVARRVRWKQLMKEFAGRIDVEAAKGFEADHRDTYLEKDFPGSRSLCSHQDIDPASNGERIPYGPGGTFDAKVVDARMAREMRFVARWGRACGAPFDAGAFLKAHAQFDWMTGILKSRLAEPWTEIQAGEKK